MSLLQSQDVVVYNLRTEYLKQINDGVGERLINVNTAFLNDPAFRTAGWNPHPPELKRCYSPPIPTSGAADYFKAPKRAVRLGESLDEEEDEEGGMVTGRHSNDTVGPAVIGRRRRRRDTPEDDDSSDLSDESNEETEPPVSARPTNTVKFARMPERARSGSSPLREASQEDGPSLMITSPSRPPDETTLRRPSLGKIGSFKTRPRRDTTTSSEVSSENDLDPVIFKRKPISARAAAAQKRLLAEQIAEEDSQDTDADVDTQNEDKDELDDSETDDDELASDFSGDLADDSFLGDERPPEQIGLSSIAETESSMIKQTAKTSKPAPDVLQALPPPRPISTVLPVSALSMAIKAKNKKATSPLDRFAVLSAPSDQSPLCIKMYMPFSSDPDTPVEMFLKKSTNTGAPLTVSELIGFALWRYNEDKLDPPIPQNKKNVNCWVLRTVEFGEVDYDFPALSRIRPMSDFTPNNNRPPRPRARDKPWDEFALVEADEDQQKQNEELTPKYSEEAAATTPEPEPVVTESLTPEPAPTAEGSSIGASSETRHGAALIPTQNPITDPRHVFASVRKDSLPVAADLPTEPVSHAVARSGAKKTVNVHYVDSNMVPCVMPIEATTDTYISEIFDDVCKRLTLEKGQFVLKVTGTSTVAPSDRMVEALGPSRSSLDLVRRRFVGDGTFALSGTPGSTSPNAPLLLNNEGIARKGRKTGPALHPLAYQSETGGSSSGMVGLGIGAGRYKRYNVIRRQAMSFTGSHARVLAIDGEYLHIMPNESTGGGKERMFDVKAIKTTTVHFSNVVGCKVSRKHPKNFRFFVFRERETKRYDFEARNEAEALEAVDEIKKGMEQHRAADR